MMQPKNKRLLTRISAGSLFLLGLAIFAGAVLNGNAATSKTQKVQPPKGEWHLDLEDGLEAARDENKPALVMISAAWCPPCNLMKKEVFPLHSVQDALTEFELIYLDGDKNPEQARQFVFRGYPTFIFLDKEGDEVSRVPGLIAEPSDFESLLESVAAYTQELEQLEVKISENPKDPVPLNEKGDLLYGRMNAREALDAYKQAAKLDEAQETPAAGNVAITEALIATLNEPSEGQVQLETYLEKYPDHPKAEDAYFLLAMIPLRESKPDKAVAALNEYLTEFPEGKYEGRVRQALERIE